MEDLSAHILDIVENSLAANATNIMIEIEEDIDKDLLSITIKDNGKGLKKELLDRVKDPFFTTRTTRRVGLGLPLLAQAASTCGGELKIDSEEGRGTLVKATFQYSHIDRQPIGDIGEALSILILSNPNVNFIYEHKKNGNLIYRLDTSQMKGDI